MPTYTGFSTLNANQPRTTNVPAGIDGGVGSINNPIVPSKKFALYDNQLVINDFINAINIPQGQKVGNPGYGSTIWSFIFEPNLPEVQIQIENELKRIANDDPRLIINTVSTYPSDNGILIEMEIAISPQNKVQQLQINFDRITGTATASTR